MLKVLKIIKNLLDVILGLFRVCIFEVEILLVCTRSRRRRVNVEVLLASFGTIRIDSLVYVVDESPRFLYLLLKAEAFFRDVMALNLKIDDVILSKEKLLFHFFSQT